MVSIHYPEHLVKEVIARSKALQLEGFVPSEITCGHRLMLVGEAPGKSELVALQPFTGKAGDNLFEQLHRIGYQRSNTYITATVKSRPYHVKQGKSKVTYPNRTPNQKEIRAHASILDWEIKNYKPQCIVTIGNIGLQRLLGRTYKVGDYHGQVIQSKVLYYDVSEEMYKETEETYTIIPTFHPAATLYNPKLKSKIIQDWDKIQTYLTNYE